MSCVLSSIVTIIATPINVLLLLAIAVNKRFHTNFYFVILNIVVCDLLIALIASPLNADINRQYAANEEASSLELNIFQIFLIAFGNTSISSMAFLSFDRMLSLKVPDRYRKLVIRKVQLVLVGIWLMSFIIAPVYLIFKIQFMEYLSMVSIVTVLLTSCVMAVAYLLYQAKLRQAFADTFHSKYDKSKTQRSESGSSIIPANKSAERRISSGSAIVPEICSDERGSADSEALNVKVVSKLDPEYQIYQIERRATRTFVSIMSVFLVCFMPVVFMGFYLTLCNSCPCLGRVLCRHLIILLFLISAILKSVVFLARLTAIRKAVYDLFISQKEAERRWRSESLATKPRHHDIRQRTESANSKSARLSRANQENDNMSTVLYAS